MVKTGRKCIEKLFKKWSKLIDIGQKTSEWIKIGQNRLKMVSRRSGGSLKV
jgi:hypothetical protein